jgi:hypothetical protein
MWLFKEAADVETRWDDGRLVNRKDIEQNRMSDGDRSHVGFISGWNLQCADGGKFGSLRNLYGNNKAIGYNGRNGQGEASRILNSSGLCRGRGDCVPSFVCESRRLSGPAQRKV